MNSIIGMLYLVNVRMTDKVTKERIRHRVLVVGGEESDIERKVKWLFDQSRYGALRISNIEKVREKVHILQTIIEQEAPAATPVIERGECTTHAPQGRLLIESVRPKLFAVGITTTMLGKDATHALRKVGHAIVSRTLPGKSHGGASLSNESTVAIEEIPFSSGVAMPKDVSNEVNQPHFVRG